MINIPLNHKTIFLFDHSAHFAVPCGTQFEFDVVSKTKSQSNASNSQQSAQQLKPLDKTIWTCLIESAIEFSRIVFDIYPENKLISLIVSKLESPLNSWNDIEQNLDHLMNVMGTVVPPRTNIVKKDEEYAILCKSIEMAVNMISQMSQLQLKLFEKHNNNNNKEIIPNSGRIILFTPTSQRNVDHIQEFLNNAIIQCNKRIGDNINKYQLKIKKCELVVVDVVRCIEENKIKEMFKLNSDFLKTRIYATKAGRDLPIKMLELVQKFYGLGVTSITNIPMKEELNANSSANYDVDILHEKSVHNQLRACGLLKNCISKQEGLEVVCLKWQNPKTNITEFNFSSESYRITPTDVNSRPAACLTTFLLGGRCVVLEARHPNNSTRIASHVLCNHGNELFMHCLVFNGKSNLDERPPINENIGETNCRLQEFNDFTLFNKLFTNNNSISIEDRNKGELLGRSINKIERITRKFPLTHNETLVGNISFLKPLIKSIVEENINPLDYNECISCLEMLQNFENSTEVLFPSQVLQLVPTNFKNLKKKDQFRALWIELECWLKQYEHLSERHKTLYDFVNILKQKSGATTELVSNDIPLENISTSKRNETQTNKTDSNEINNYDNHKIVKKQKIDIMPLSTLSLFDLWTNNLKKVSKQKKEFYGRSVNPSLNTVPLYSHLKIDESNMKPFKQIDV